MVCSAEEEAHMPSNIMVKELSQPTLAMEFIKALGLEVYEKLLWANNQPIHVKYITR